MNNLDALLKKANTDSNFLHSVMADARNDECVKNAFIASKDIDEFTNKFKELLPMLLEKRLERERAILRTIQTDTSFKNKLVEKMANEITNKCVN